MSDNKDGFSEAFAKSRNEMWRNIGSGLGSCLPVVITISAAIGLIIALFRAADDESRQIVGSSYDGSQTT